MSMYKTIFWSDEYADLSTDQSIQLTNGDALVFGESAFSTLDEAVAAAAGSNAIVIKVASGKYDSFTVINEGVTMTDVNVVAVDFNGGEVMVDGENITVADSGLTAEAQASILADLNDSNAGRGKIFVAADLAPETATTLYVGMGEANYVVGQNAEAVYGENAEEVYTVLNNMANVAMLGSTSVNVADGATETVSFTSTSGGYYINGTVAAGGTLKSAAVPNRGDSIVIVGGGFTIGSADSDKKAVVDFQTERFLSIKVERNNLAAFNVNNADMKVGDLWLNKASKNTFANTTLDIKGVFVALSNGTTITDSTVTVSGHRRIDSVTKEDNILSRVTLNNSTITFNDGADGTVPAKVWLGYTDHATASTLTMNGSTINVESGTVVQVGNTVTMTEGSKLTGGKLEILDGKVLKLDSSCKLTLDSLDLGANGTITINLLDGFTGGQLIDITGKTGLTNDILEKITFTGMPENLSAAVVDGDIFVVGQSAALEFKDEEHATLTDKVVAKDVTLENSKELAVTDGIHATNSAEITNAKDGETEGKLNGGYDDGKELAAKISAENNIILQNDGHANVDLDAKNIFIANNSKNTLIGSIGTADTENVIIADGEATADGVDVDDNGVADGAIKDATITADFIQISGQEVTNTTFDGNTILSGSTVSGGVLGGTDDIVSVVGSDTTVIDTALNVKTFEVRDGAVFTNSQDITASGVYVGFNNMAATEAEEDSYGKFTVAAGTTVTGSNALHIRPDAELVIDGTVNSGLIQIKDSSVTINESGKLVQTHFGAYLRNAGEGANGGGSELTVKGELAFQLGANNMADTSTIDIDGGSTLTVDGGKITSTYGNGGDANDKHVIDVNADGVLNVKGGSIDVDSVINNGTFTVSGESTLNIGNFTRDTSTDDKKNSTRIQIKDGTTLVDSKIGNGSINLNGDLTVENGLEVYELRGGKELPNAIESVISGDKITVTGYGKLENGTYTINADMDFGGYVYLSDGTFTITSDLRAGAVPGENSNGYPVADGAFWIEGDVTLEDGASMDAYNGGNIVIGTNDADAELTIKTGAEAKVYDISLRKDTASLNIDGGKVTASHAVTGNGVGSITITDGTLITGYITQNIVNDQGVDFTNISITVTAEKLAGINGEYVIFEQTVKNAYATDINDVTVTIDGKGYTVGDTAENNTFEKDGVVYTLTNGDGNDIVIQAAAKILTVNSSYTEATPGFGFSKFNDFTQALESAASGVDEVEIAVSGAVNAGANDNGDIYKDFGGKTINVTGSDAVITFDNVNDIVIDNVTLNIGEGVTVNNNNKYADEHVMYVGYFNASNINIDGTLKLGDWAVSNDNGTVYINQGKITVSETGKLDADFAIRSRDDLEVIGNGSKEDVQVLSQRLELMSGGSSATASFTNSYVKATEYVSDALYNSKNNADTSSKVFTFDNTKLETKTIGIHSTETDFIVSNGSVVDVSSSVSNAGYLEVSGSSFNAGSMTISGGMELYNADMTVANNVAFKEGAYAFIAENTVMSAKDVTVASGAAVDIDASAQLKANSLTIADDANFTISASEIYTANDWVPSYEGGLVKVVDVNKAVNGKVEMIKDDAEQAAKLFYGNDGDIYITDQDKMTVSINSSYTSDDEGFGATKLNSFDGLQYMLDANTGAADNVVSDEWDTTVYGGTAAIDKVQVSGDITFDSLTAKKATFQFTDATVNAGDAALSVEASAAVDIENSSFNVGDITNNGSLTVTGDSDFAVSKVADADGSGTMTFGDAEGERSNISLGKVNGTGAEYTQKTIYFYNSNLSLNEDLTINGVDGTWHQIHSSNVDLNGKTLTINSQYFLINALHGTDAQGTTLGAGTYNINTNHLCFQRYNHVISEGATINVNGSSYGSHMVNVYGSLTIEGQLYSTRNGKDIFTYANVGTTDTGWSKPNYPEATLTVTGSNAKYIVENGHTFYVYHEREATGAGTLKVLDGAEFSYTGNGYGEFYNGNKVYVDAESSFTVTNYYGSENGYKGSFNSDNAGEMVVLGNVTVQNKLVTDSLIINQGGVLSAGSITVTDLTIAIGGSLNLNGSATVSSGYINVIGELKPENAEYTLVTNGWDKLSGLQIRYDVNNDNVYSTDEYFTVGTAGTNGYLFTVNGDSLYISKQNANITGIYIGSDVPASGTFTADNGAKYTVGVDAFATFDDAKAASFDKSLITSLTLGSADLVSAAKAEFVNLNDIRIEAGVTITDTAASNFTGDLNIDNDGHLDAQITVGGDLTFTNTAKDTLVGSYTAENITGTNTGAMAGSYTADYEIVIDNNTGSIGGDKGEATFNASNVAITGGDASNVTVNAGNLDLSDTNTFGLNANSGILDGGTWGAGLITLNGSANLSIDGDNDSISVGIDSANHTGTVTFNGEQTYTGDISAFKFVVSEDSDVTVTSGQFDFNELNIQGTLNNDFTAQDSYTSAGKLTGNGVLNSTHNETWIVNDSVTRDVSKFYGSVNMTQDNAAIVMGKGDATAADTAENSYFANGSTVTAKDGQSIYLAGNGITTGINFAGNGTINVGNYTDGAFAEQSEDFSQTLSGTNTGFEGTINVSEGAKLTVENALGATSINMDYESIPSATDVADEHDTQLILNKEGLALAAAIKGDANDIIDIQKNATLSATGALNNFAGNVKVDDNTLTLGGVNNTNAKFSGTTDAVIDANAAQTLAADGALNDFNGTVALEGNTLTLDGANETAAKFTGTNLIDANANQNLTAAGALNGFEGTVALEGNTLTLGGANETAAKFTGTTAAVIDANANQNLTAAGALNDFNGTVALEGNTLTLGAENTTSATITGTAAAVVDADANQTFNGDVTGFAGHFDIATGKSVTLNGTFSDTENQVVNAIGGTLNLGDKTANVTVNATDNNDATTDDKLSALSFSTNDVTLGTGDFDSVTGTGDILDFGQDQTFGTVEAGTIYVTGSQDELTIGTLTADINITVDAAQATGAFADVTVNTAFTGDINVNVNDGSYVEGGYKLATYTGFTTDSTITLSVAGSTGETVKVDKLVLIDGKAYLLQLKDNTLILTKMNGYSNYVAVDGDWSSKVPYQAVTDGTTERIIGYDAADSLDDAVSFIKGRPEGLNWGTADGDAMIELTEGKYTLTTGTLMTDANGVTQLTLKGRDGQTATITGVIAGSDGSDETTLTLENVRIQGELYGGGKLVINNASDLRSSGNSIAAGVLNADMANGSELVLNGGYFGNRVIAGGSVNTEAGKTITVDGKTSLVIDNKSTAQMVITGSLVGGSWAGEGTVVQTKDAEILINVENATWIRGNIFVNGGAGNGTLTMNGNSMITFTGNASLLTFTGTVNAINGEDTTEAVVFNNFTGEFNGSISGFDTITISGDTSLELGRRQHNTANTELEFVINSETGTDAMYIVRDANYWEFAKTINIDVDNAKVGNHVLVDNYIKGFEGFTFTFGETDAVYTLGTAVTVADKQYTVNASGDSLVLDVVQVYSGNVSGNVSGTSVLENATVSGNVAGSDSLAMDTSISGTTTIAGTISSRGKSDNIEVAEGAVVTVSGGNTSGNDGVFLGDGDDNLSVGKGAHLKVDTQINGGTGKNILTMAKGSTVETWRVTNFGTDSSMDVDSVLNMHCADGNPGNTVANVKVNVTGISDLTTNLAGAKTIVTGVSSIQGYLKAEGVDMVLGTAKCINDNGTDADTSDDVWASLNRVDGNLVVAWGRSEAEVGAALDAFNHYKDNNTDLVLGDAVVSSDLADGFNTTDTLEKKSNGTLA
ncbi:MAG: hypothetical protein E7054_04615 [Lentisphaerae bacterium]|nr:hypothetical protein [Lentisphaerota bacterium]